MQTYSQLKATLAITKASLRAIFRSPSAVVFGFLFPMIFILVFGFISGGGSAPVHKIALLPGTDTTNPVFAAIKNSRFIKLYYFDNDAKLAKNYKDGRIAGKLGIYKKGGDSAGYSIRFKATTASSDKYFQFLTALENLVGKVNDAAAAGQPKFVKIDFDEARDIEKVMEYSTIDFILPGQLGFSLLSAGVFGVAFMFFNLRNTLVLKRFYATPIRRINIVLGETLSRVTFQMITAVVILLMGYFFFGFHLRHGIITFIELLVLSFIGLVVFMGFGFIISSLAKSESSIPALANMLTLPQFLLAGTFFSIENFPKWLQPLCNILPLTHLNNAMRAVAFEGVHIYNCGKQLGILGIWIVITYFIAVKVFKWE